MKIPTQKGEHANVQSSPYNEKTESVKLMLKGSKCY